MAVDLGDYTDALRRLVDPPGVVIDTEATDDDFASRLSDGFWILVLQGFDFLLNFNGPDVGASGSTVVTPKNAGAPDLPREMVQLIVFTAGVEIVRSRLLALKTRFSAKAGPVSIDLEQSSQAWQLIYKDLIQQRSFFIRRLSDLGIIPTYITNADTQKDFNLFMRDDFWVR